MSGYNKRKRMRRFSWSNMAMGEHKEFLLWLYSKVSRFRSSQEYRGMIGSASRVGMTILTMRRV